MNHSFSVLCWPAHLYRSLRLSFWGNSGRALGCAAAREQTALSDLFKPSSPLWEQWALLCEALIGFPMFIMDIEIAGQDINLSRGSEK